MEKSQRFQAGKDLSEYEKKAVLSSMQDSYVVKQRPYQTEEYPHPNGYVGKRRVWLGDPEDFMITSDVTHRLLRWYVLLPDDRIAHPTEVYPGIKQSAINAEIQRRQEDEYRVLAGTESTIEFLRKNDLVAKFIGFMRGCIEGGATIEEDGEGHYNTLVWGTMRKRWFVHFEQYYDNAVQLPATLNLRHDRQYLNSLYEADLRVLYKTLSGQSTHTLTEQTARGYLGDRKSAIFATLTDNSDGSVQNLILLPDQSSRKLNVSVDGPGGVRGKYRFQYAYNQTMQSILDDQREYWAMAKGSYTIDFKNVQAKLNATSKAQKVVKAATPRQDQEDAEELVRLTRKRLKTHKEEWLIAYYKDRIQARVDKWNVGDGVGYRVGSEQINRGFRIDSIDADSKSAVVRPVADTGLTNSGGNFDRIGPTKIHVADLVRDRKYDAPENVPLPVSAQTSAKLKLLKQRLKLYQYT